MSAYHRALPWASLHEGFALAKQLMLKIESAEICDDTMNVDLFAIADQIQQAVMVEDEQVRRGVFLALADYLSTSRGARSISPNGSLARPAARCWCGPWRSWARAVSHEHEKRNTSPKTRICKALDPEARC